MTASSSASAPHGVAAQRLRRTARIAVNRAFDAERAPRVLAVDDHPVNLKLVAAQLRALGSEVGTAACGDQALRLWRSGEFDAVLTDCNMGGLDGYALAATIREFERAGGHPRLPIVGWTASALAETRDACLAAGMDAVLVKPVALEALRGALGRWFPRLAADAVGDAAAPAAAPLPLDLAELAAVVDADAIVVEFLAQTAGDLDDLRAALHAGDEAGVARILHRLRGASLMVGARALAARCATPLPAAAAADAGAALAAIEHEVARIHDHAARRAVR